MTPVITVRSLEAAFQPVSPSQKLSDEPLVAPASGITFYQAYVRIENRGQAPLRIDPRDFFCRIDDTLSPLEPTRSGPIPRSIVFGTSLDLVLTFRGATGAEPTLIYNPTWYAGIISFSERAAGAGGSVTTTTGVTTETPSTDGQTTPLLAVSRPSRSASHRQAIALTGAASVPVSGRGKKAHATDPVPR